jgi:hypothetical protein
MKTRIIREELQDLALSAVQREPGCAGVKSISVATVTIVNDGSTDWHLEILDPGDASPEIAYRAAHRVKEELARRFELREPQKNSGHKNW